MNVDDFVHVTIIGASLDEDDASEISKTQKPKPSSIFLLFSLLFCFHRWHVDPAMWAVNNSTSNLLPCTVAKILRRLEACAIQCTKEAERDGSLLRQAEQTQIFPPHALFVICIDASKSFVRPQKEYKGCASQVFIMHCKQHRRSQICPDLPKFSLQNKYH